MFMGPVCMDENEVGNAKARKLARQYTRMDKHDPTVHHDSTWRRTSASDALKSQTTPVKGLGEF